MLNLDNETIALDSTLSRVELEELFAMKAVLGNPDIVNNVCVFEKLCFALNGEIPSFEVINIPTVLDIAVAIKKLPKFIPNETITKYVAIIAWNDGFSILPSILKFAQPYLTKISSDLSRELFANYTPESLEKYEVIDELDPISINSLKLKAINHFLQQI